MTSNFLPTGAIALIRDEEGFNSCIYECTGGARTIGYGLNLDAGMSRAVAEAALSAQLKESWSMIVAEKPWVTELPDPIQAVLASMVYQLGVTGCLNFKKMWAALLDRDYDTAAAEMKDSRWYQQTTARAERACRVVKNGQCYLPRT